MKVDQFDFELPKELIAIRPAPSRDGARLLVVDGNSLKDEVVNVLPDFIKPDDLMIFNDTRVIPARLSGKRRDAKMELTLHMNMSNGVWKAFAKPAKKLKVDDVINFKGGLDALVTEKGEAGEVTIQFNKTDDMLSNALNEAGVMPLPPYIASQRPVDDRDLDDYQTIYSKHDG
ncbi:MAG: S-adenosylmethionine:tRNA ribosyltransferase-isomerase, partial [Emcibacteraceae bacterium]|nr:S-adenosylmethionine:tRNA ribosyltransferase-isomerase [Emcibacteraceae bacterium]